ncbi:MAG: hypothetical protein PVH65_17650 [Chloroflexota bacterium]
MVDIVPQRTAACGSIGTIDLRGAGPGWVADEVHLTPEELVACLVSAFRCLTAQVRPFFAGTSLAFAFLTRAWYLRKIIIPDHEGEFSTPERPA